MNPDRPYRRGGSSRLHLVEEALTHEIIGGFFETYNELGFGFRESIYKRGLEIVLRRRGLLVEREFPVEVFFQGTQIGFHRIDMLVEGRVIIEAKATHKLVYADKLQLMNYLAAMNLEVGLLLHLVLQLDSFASSVREGSSFHGAIRKIRAIRTPRLTGRAPNAGSGKREAGSGKREIPASRAPLPAPRLRRSSRAPPRSSS